MLRMKDVPLDQMAEVVRVAGELYDAEQAQTQERRATVAAAAEIGLPKEYLDRAASVVHARRVEQIETQRRRRAGLLVGIGVAVAFGGGWFVTHPRPAVPLAYNFQSSQWTQESDPASKAAVTFANGTATLHVDHKLDEAGQTFRILIIKTNMTIPYPSVFLQLNCKYWSADAEQRLRAQMPAEAPATAD